MKTFKDIHKELNRRFPSCHIVVGETTEIRTGYYAKPVVRVKEYGYYVASSKLFEHGWSPKFNSMINMINHVKETLKNYDQRFPTSDKNEYNDDRNKKEENTSEVSTS